LALLLIVTRMVGLSEAARREARELIFPAAKYAPPALERAGRGDGVAQPYADEASRANRLIALLTSANAALSQASQQLVWLLCDGAGDEVTRLVGFGSAAGLLAMRGLLRPPADPLDTAAAPRSNNSQHNDDDDDDTRRLLRQLAAKPENESDDHRVTRIGRALHDLEQKGFA
jgi:hypothetical protein